MYQKILFYPSLLYNILLRGEKKKWANVIEPNIILGALPLSRYLDEIFNLAHIKNVISVVEDYEYRHIPLEKLKMNGVKTHLWLKCREYSGVPSEKDISQALEVIENAKILNEAVYIHCKAGKGRSAIITACYLMKTYKIDYKSALNRIRNKRPQINLSSYQLNFLSKFNVL